MQAFVFCNQITLHFITLYYITLHYITAGCHVLSLHVRPRDRLLRLQAAHHGPAGCKHFLPALDHGGEWLQHYILNLDRWAITLKKNHLLSLATFGGNQNRGD